MATAATKSPNTPKSRPVPARPKITPAPAAVAKEDPNTITGTVGGAEDQAAGSASQSQDPTPQFRWSKARYAVLIDAMVNQGMLTTAALVPYLQSHPECAADAHLLTARKIGVAVGRLIDEAAEEGYVFPRLKHPGLSGGPRINYAELFAGVELPAIVEDEGEQGAE